MNKTTFLIAVAIAFLVYWYSRKIDAAKNFTYQIGSPREVKLFATSLQFLLDIKVTNADSAGVNINSSNTEIYIKNGNSYELVSNNALFTATKIAGKAVTSLPLTVQINYLDLYAALRNNVSSLSGLYEKLRAGIEFNLKGNLVTESVPIKIDQNFKLKI